MKTQLAFFLAVLVSVFSTVSVQAGGHHGHGGFRGFAPSGGRGMVSGRSGFSGYRSGNFRYGDRRMIGSSGRFYAMRSSQNAFGPYYAGSGRGYLSNGRRSFGTTRYNGQARSIGRGNRGFAGANNYVFARHSGNWHRDWDHHHDHWWHGHRCRFIDGSWVVFGLGFYPWYGYGYPYGYSPYYSYYPYPYYSGYPYQYDQGVFDSAPVDNNGEGSYDSSKDADSPVAAAQTRLAKAGYYRGEVDGVSGPETTRAIMRYQSDKVLAPTGRLSRETLESLGLR
jgi:hypothetical protein